MPLQWEAHSDAFGGWRPVGQPEVDLERLKQTLPSIARIRSIGDSFFSKDSAELLESEQRIREGKSVAGDYVRAMMYARGQRKAGHLRDLVLSAYSAGRLDEVAEGIGDLFCIGAGVIPQSCVRFSETYLELVEYAACSERGGTGEGSLAAEAAFDLGRYWFEQRRRERAVYWWHRSYELGIWEGACALGECFSAGFGVRKDPLEAARWFMKIGEFRETFSSRWFSQEWVPVNAQAGWVRNGALLASLANALTVDTVPQLMEIVGANFNRLVVRSADGYVALEQDDLEEYFSTLQ